ncbi:MAG TPA: BlaI/MecI/CopY family transcriptional regulator [Candidatus Acidoferrales bacterium]|jgi:predicted transcriptional regulator|nr:BlaI/MecI/CopY family transcriptional regulator [Candidatus Acidoferrales bacterium]
MAANHSTEKRNGRHAILDLAPLELDCLRILWPIGEGTVRDIRDGLRDTRPRAYTTIMTIMDRMAQKGIVSRRKVGRAWLYSPNITAGEARERAVHRLVEHFFAGSPAALEAQLAEQGAPKQPPGPGAEAERARRGEAQPRAKARIPTPEESAPATSPAPKMDDALL